MEMLKEARKKHHFTNVWTTYRKTFHQDMDDNNIKDYKIYLLLYWQHQVTFNFYNFQYYQYNFFIKAIYFSYTLILCFILWFFLYYVLLLFFNSRDWNYLNI